MSTTLLVANNASVKIDSVDLHDATFAALRSSIPNPDTDQAGGVAMRRKSLLAAPRATESN
jgi:hypothetical protein